MFARASGFDLGLREDVPFGDLTTRLLAIEAEPARMVFKLRRDGVVCGVERAREALLAAGLSCTCHASSGQKLEAGSEILEAAGSAGALHRVWKTSQTAIEYLSGIATATAEIVAAARQGHPACVVVTTRKTFPGARELAIEAIRAGGAEPHRTGLSETILVFPEHRVFLADPLAALASLRAKAPEKTIVVEVTSLDEACRYLHAEVDVLQCEKMTSAEIALLDKRRLAIRPSLRIAAAGGINAENAEAYARAGANILVTSAPYWSPPRDVKVILSPL